MLSCLLLTNIRKLFNLIVFNYWFVSVPAGTDRYQASHIKMTRTSVVEPKLFISTPAVEPAPAPSTASTVTVNKFFIIIEKICIFNQNTGIDHFIHKCFHSRIKLRFGIPVLT